MTEPLEITLIALDSLTSPYFGLDFYGDGMLNATEANEETRETAFRHWERVFCYELYHKIRTIIDNKIKENKNREYWEKISLQGELQKKELTAMSLSQKQLSQLEKEYIPDLLFHEIHTTNYQELIIEVKTKADMTFSTFKDDLNKIAEFIRSYRFKRGLFVAANNDFSEIEKQIKNNLDKISINEKIQSNIYIAVRKNANEKTKWKKLDEITGLNAL